MREILFLAHRIPFPPDRGDKIRSHHVLRRLAEIGPVHVATLAENEFDLAEESALAAMAASYHLARRSKPLPLAGLEALASGKPVSVTAFHSSALQSYIDRVLATRSIGAIYVFSGQMGHYVPESFKGRVVMDFVDVDSAKFEAYGAKKSGPRGWIDAREGRELAREEARLARRADVSLLISDEERDLFVSRLPSDVRADVQTMGNGLDAEFFDPARQANWRPSPGRRSCSPARWTMLRTSRRPSARSTPSCRWCAGPVPMPPSMSSGAIRRKASSPAMARRAISCGAGCPTCASG